MGVSPRSLLCFFLSLGATGAIFFINALPLNTYSGATCSPVPRLRLRLDKCVASPCSDIDVGFSFLFRPTPSRLLFPICLLRLVPPPPGVGGVGCCRFAAAGIAAVYLLVFLLCRSLADAHSLFRFGSSCVGVLLDYPVGAVPSSLVVRPSFVRCG